MGTASDEVSAPIITRAWSNAIAQDRESGLAQSVLYVSARDWNIVAQRNNLEKVSDRNLPQVTRFEENPVMVVTELPPGVAYLGRRLMP